MKLLTGLVLVLSLAVLPSNAAVVTLTKFYEKISTMFSLSCPHEAPSQGLALFKSELESCYESKAIPEPEELKLTGVPLGLEGDFPDEYIYASSYRDENSYPARCRLNMIKEGELNGAWCSEVNNDLQFLQVDLGAVSTITAIFTQGDHDELNWVQSYTMEISMDGFHWGCVFGEDGRVKEFEGNTDSETVKINVMHPFIECRYIRIVPKSWTGHICLRLEIYVEEIKEREEEEEQKPDPDFETKVLEVNSKRPDALVIKNDEPNQVDTGVLPEQYTDERPAPIKSILFEQAKLQPDLYQVQPEDDPDFETKVLEVNPKRPDALVIKNDEPNQVDTGVLPEQYTDERPAPIKSIFFEQAKLQPDLYQVQPEDDRDFETQVLEVNPKNPDPLVIRNDKPNQVDMGVVPEEYTDEQSAPIKTFSFEYPKQNPDLYEVQPAGVFGRPLKPIRKKQPLIISGGGPVVDKIVAPGLYNIPVEVGTFYETPGYTFEYEWQPEKYKKNMVVEFAFRYAVNIIGFSTKGRPDQWVTAYKIEYLHPYLNKWVWLKGENKENIRIDGNSDDSSTRDHVYQPAIFTSRFRMYILNWHEDEEAPYMIVQLYMLTEPREAPQIVTGPIYEGGLIWWSWEELEPEEDYTQEVYFQEELSLEKFKFGADSTIADYRLQYLNLNGEWAEIAGDDGTTLSFGETLDVSGIAAKGLRIIILSWSGDGLYAGMYLEVKEETATFIEVIDIVELSSHYLFFDWEDSNPVPGSELFFNFGGIVQVTRIETRGKNGNWASSYQLECRTHFAENGEIMKLSGNSNDQDIVEHIFDDPRLQCKYIFIIPDLTDGVGMEVYIYTDVVAKDAKARILIPGARGGVTEGTWSPAEYGKDPYIEFVFDHHARPTSITLTATEGSSVTKYELQKKRSKEGTFEPVFIGPNQIQVFDLGETIFKRQFDVVALRIFPKVDENSEGNIGFEWKIPFTSDETISVVPYLHPGAGEEETEPSGPSEALNGHYYYEGKDEGQSILFAFEKPEIINKFILKEDTVSVKSFKLWYKTETSGDFVTFTYEGKKVIRCDKDGIELDMGGLEVTALKMVVLKVRGKETKFEYQIQFTGNVDGLSTSYAFEDDPEED